MRAVVTAEVARLLLLPDWPVDAYTVILLDIESITMFTLTASAHSAATGAPRYRFHRLDLGRLSGKFGSEIVPLQRSPQPGGVPGSYMHAW